MDMGDKLIRIDSVRIPKYRDANGSCIKLAHSIRDDGLHRPITVWSDGTLISGRRRLIAHMLLERERIPAVYVHTIEDAAKRMLGDFQDTTEALDWKWSEACRLWEVIRRLDAPAAKHRAAENRRRGVELRRQTQSGQRPPGRTHTRTDDYVLTVLAEPFGVSAATAARVEIIYQTAFGERPAPDDKRDLAREVMADIDKGGSVWANYQRFMGQRTVAVSRPAPVVPAASAPVKQQLAAWAKALPQLEGLALGLIELGPPNPELTWDQVGPVHTRLMAVRRELEKMIKQMKGISKP